MLEIKVITTVVLNTPDLQLSYSNLAESLLTVDNDTKYVIYTLFHLLELLLSLNFKLYKLNLTQQCNIMKINTSHCNEWYYQVTGRAFLTLLASLGRLFFLSERLSNSLTSPTIRGGGRILHIECLNSVAIAIDSCIFNTP